MTWRPVLPFVLAAVFAAAPAAAQYTMVSPMLYHGPQISFQAHVAAQNSGRQDRAQTRPADTAALLAYRRDPDRSRANLDSFVRHLSGGDASEVAELRKTFNDGFFDLLTPQAAARGLQVNNVADAYAVWWINAWMASRGKNDEPSAASLRAVRRQAADALAATPQMRGASDATKQELAESLWVQALVLDASIDQAKGQADRLKLVGDAAVSGARAMGLDLTAMRLTDAGFVAA